ncbi:hypothetical protein GCM10009554_52970 [Kribbella koreensis]|uniref:Uncharacterized protein n=1 Tax=Kribbella koreensis TaxID=57909 RepID=A0ABP4BL71_9ACTN
MAAVITTAFESDMPLDTIAPALKTADSAFWKSELVESTGSSARASLPFRLSAGVLVRPADGASAG